MSTPVVTRVRETARGRVAVELDGAPWRVLPIDAVARIGLAEGTALDRPLARRLRQELRRVEAASVALRALRRRDHSKRALAERLEQRHVPAGMRDEVLETLERVGLVDDARSAHGRAAALAERGSGDALIRHDLERRGFSPQHVEAALDALEPERERARRLLATRGGGPRELRRLAARGFSGDALEGLVAEAFPDELG